MLLLDSHVLLWALGDEGKLRPGAFREIRDPSQIVYFSPASVWELEIKRAQGKLDLPDDWTDVVAQSRFTELAITAKHAEKAGRLPWHHRDPFDRMLIAQAIVENLRLVTRDRLAASYGVPLLEA